MANKKTCMWQTGRCTVVLYVVETIFFIHFPYRRGLTPRGQLTWILFKTHHLWSQRRLLISGAWLYKRHTYLVSGLILRPVKLVRTSHMKWEHAERRRQRACPAPDRTLRWLVCIAQSRSIFGSSDFGGGGGGGGERAHDSSRRLKQTGEAREADMFSLAWNVKRISWHILFFKITIIHIK